MRKHNLKLYPGVYDTLNILYEKKVRIIGYTDSAEENGYYRLKKLGIDFMFEKVYLSSSIFKKQKTDLKKIEIVDTKKPDSATLLQICKRENVNLDEVVYVGDSLTKDIYMAHWAGIDSILVNYGKTSPEMYDKLVAISHWTKDDFLRDKEIRQKCIELDIKPTYEVEDFRQILDVI